MLLGRVCSGLICSEVSVLVCICFPYHRPFEASQSDQQRESLMACVRNSCQTPRSTGSAANRICPETSVRPRLSCTSTCSRCATPVSTVALICLHGGRGLRRKFRKKGFCLLLNLPLVSREWKNGSNSSYNNCTPFLHSLLTKGRFKGPALKLPVQRQESLAGRSPARCPHLGRA